MKVYKSENINEVLKKEQCPDYFDYLDPWLPTGVQPRLANSDKNNQKTSNQFDRSDLSEINEEDLLRSKSNHNWTRSSNTKHPWDKKPSDKKDYRGDRDQHKKKDQSGHPDDKSKPHKYDNSYDSFNLFLQSPKEHRSKKPYQFGMNYHELPDRHPNFDKLDSYDLTKPGLEKTDDPNYPNGFRPPHLAATHRTKYPMLIKPGIDFSSSSYDPFLIRNFRFSELPNSSKRSGRSPHFESSQDDYEYSNLTDMSDSRDRSSDESSKRVPRRGDIGIQSLDERGGYTDIKLSRLTCSHGNCFPVCQTDDQLVKTLNELINATKKLWRELELNVS